MTSHPKNPDSSHIADDHPNLLLSHQYNDNVIIRRLPCYLVGVNIIQIPHAYRMKEIIMAAIFNFHCMEEWWLAKINIQLFFAIHHRMHHLCR